MLWELPHEYPKDDPEATYFPQRMTMPISGATCRHRCLNSLACRACRRG